MRFHFLFVFGYRNSSKWNHNSSSKDFHLYIPSGFLDFTKRLDFSSGISYLIFCQSDIFLFIEVGTQVKKLRDIYKEVYIVENDREVSVFL